MSELLKDTLIDKVDIHDREIQEIKETVKNLVNYKEVLNQQNNNITELKTAISNLSFPVTVMQNLSGNLAASIEDWKQPTETVHHHHVPKIILIAAGLFLILCLVCMGWYMTANRLGEYKAGDIKYRLLKLQDGKYLQQVLHETDSLYRLNPAVMRDSVIQQEEDRERQIQLEMEIRNAEKEVKQLKEKAGKPAKK